MHPEGEGGGLCGGGRWVETELAAVVLKELKTTA